MPPPAMPDLQAGSQSAEPGVALVSASTVEFMLMELVPMSYRVGAEVLLRDQALTGDLARQIALANGASSTAAAETGARASRSRKSTRLSDGHTLPGLRDRHGNLVGGGVAGVGGNLGGLGEEELREAAAVRLDHIGHRVGQGMAERFSRQHSRFADTLEIIKFVCKDIWTVLFHKPIDNLKTNHRGVFVLTDKAFRPISRISFDRASPTSRPDGLPGSANEPGPTTIISNPSGSTPSIRLSDNTAWSEDPGSLSSSARPDSSVFSSVRLTTAGADEVDDLDQSDQTGDPIEPAIPQPRTESQMLAQTQPFLRFPCGVIRGVLTAVGLTNVTVTAECTSLPTAVFQVRVGPGPVDGPGAGAGAGVGAGSQLGQDGYLGLSG